MILSSISQAVSRMFSGQEIKIEAFRSFDHTILLKQFLAKMATEKCVKKGLIIQVLLFVIFSLVFAFPAIKDLQKKEVSLWKHIFS